MSEPSEDPALEAFTKLFMEADPAAFTKLFMEAEPTAVFYPTAGAVAVTEDGEEIGLMFLNEDGHIVHVILNLGRADGLRKSLDGLFQAIEEGA